jgi:hypothetical protein
MAVPCALVDGFSLHLNSGLDERMLLHWLGWTTMVVPDEDKEEEEREHGTGSGGGEQEPREPQTHETKTATGFTGFLASNPHTKPKKTKTILVPISAVGQKDGDVLNILKQNQAFGDADTIILLDKSCRNFFTQGRSLKEVREVLSTFASTAKYDASLGAVRAVTEGSGQGIKARIKLSDYFFSNDSDRIYSYNPTAKRYEDVDFGYTPRQFRALTVLHELAHALGLIPKDGRGADRTGKQSGINDATIDKQCGGGINNVPATN